MNNLYSDITNLCCDARTVSSIAVMLRDYANNATVSNNEEMNKIIIAINPLVDMLEKLEQNLEELEEKAYSNDNNEASTVREILSGLDELRNISDIN